MTVLKCKMCGGDLKFEEGVTVVDCEYCGTKQTVPTIDDEKKITLFARANKLRFACEFDKASGIYESIVADFPEEAEAYWGLVLCKYGIEYVDDPATGKKIPTCHRSSFENVMEDENFEQVLENADPIARTVYREEAKQIEELRRGIIEVSNKEEPYDIFICYKETTENGERTIDSVIAQDVYHELTEKGYRVFFSRITLEDKLGQEYEPYIFAALNSARIMLAFGTDYEYYNAVWVKNEWSRFLQMIARGEKKTLIPCYKNIDAYDMPKEFARLQAQDMGKVGAMQDLLRGIEKLFPKKENEQTVQAQSENETAVAQQPAQSATIDSLLKRAFMYLEDGDWRNAAEYCNRVLDISPENAEAYVGFLMAELRVSKEAELARQTKSFGQDKHFIKAVRFAGEERREILEGYRNTAEMEISRLMEEKRAYCQQLEKKRWELKKRRELQTKKGSIAVGEYSHGEDDVKFIFARIWDGDYRTAATYVRGNYPWTGSDIVDIARGLRHTVGLKSDGTVVAVGEHEDGKCNTSDWRDITAITAGIGCTIGIQSDGTVVMVDVMVDDENSFQDMSGWSDIVATVTGYAWVAGLKSDGTVVISCSEKRVSVPDWKDIVDIAGNGYILAGLKSDGTVVTINISKTEWKPDVADWENVVAIEMGDHIFVGLKSDGTVVAAGGVYKNFLCRMSSWKDIVTIAVDDGCVVGLKSDGTVVAVHSDDYGEEVKVSEWKDIIAVSAYHAYPVGLKSDGTILYGRNEFNWIEDAEEEQRYEEQKMEEQKMKEQKMKEQKERRRLSNLCQHCGGSFKGLFNKKCTVCGKGKDY